MTNTNRLKTIYAGVAASSAAILFITVATIVGELYKPFKGWLKITFSHHWIGKGVLALVIFAVIFILIFVFSCRRKDSCTESGVKKSLDILSWITVFSILVLVAFFILHWMGLL